MNNSSPLFSEVLVTVILINRNHGHTLRQTIESYLNQSEKRLQILCIDGASTDNSLEILKTYPQVSLISEPDRSGSEALVKGIKSVTGKYLMIATSNDVLLDQNFVKKSLEVMENDSSYSCVFGKVLSMDSNGLIGKDIHPYTDNYFGSYRKNFLRWLLNGASFHECASVFRTETVLKCLPDLESFVHEIQNLDEDLTLRLRFEFYSNGFKAQFINLPAIAVRDHQDRTSVMHKQHIINHLKFYDNQLLEFRNEFIKTRRYYFKDGGNLGEIRLGNVYVFVSCFVIVIKKFRRNLGVVKRTLFLK